MFANSSPGLVERFVSIDTRGHRVDDLLGVVRDAIRGIAGVDANDIRRQLAALAVPSREFFSACDRALSGVNLDDDVRDVREQLLLLTRRLSVGLRYGTQRGNGQPLAAAEQIVLGRERRSLDVGSPFTARRLPLSIRTPCSSAAAWQ